MQLTSFTFLFAFLPVSLLFLLFLKEKLPWQNAALLILSVLFCAASGLAGFLAGLLETLAVYAFARLLARNKSPKARKTVFTLGVLFCAGLLCYFKYTNFLLETLSLPTVSLLPAPLGVSFLTFLLISYLADVYRKTAEYEPSFVNFAMYISMFPQLIAGPIVTYSSIKKEISRRSHSMRAVEEGLKTFTIGLGLKVLLANRLGGLWNEAGTVGYESISTPFAWLAITAFSLQIYFDFYGYSLMAKGLGRIMGFTIPENFHDPYLSLSMTEFWRRWHMTLGSWFRDYVYIPLGGSRKGKLMTFRNMLAVWALTGFWHGASWNFILWGLLMFALISVEKLGLIRILERVPALGHLYMAFAISVSWVLFAVTDLSQMAVYFTRLFPFLPQSEGMAYFAGDYLKYGRLYGLSLAAGLVFATGLPMKLYRRFKNSPAAAVVLLAVFWGCVYCMKMGMDDPFLYFRF